MARYEYRAPVDPEGTMLPEPEAGYVIHIPADEENVEHWQFQDGTDALRWTENLLVARSEWTFIYAVEIELVSLSGSNQ